METKYFRIDREDILNFIFICVGTCIYALGLSYFLVPNDIIDGGVVGISLMADYLLEQVHFAVCYILLNLPFVYMGAKALGRGFAIFTGLSVAMFSVWSTVWGEIFPRVMTSDPLLATVFGGIITGLGLGIVIKSGGSLDGTEIVGILVNKRLSVPVGEVVMLINVFILGGAGLVYGWDQAMYSLMAFFIIAKTMDSVLKGMDNTCAVTIISGVGDTIAAEMVKLGKGVTITPAKGGYLGDDKQVILCVMSRLEVPKIKNIVRHIDPCAVLTVSTIQESVGGYQNDRCAR